MIAKTTDFTKKLQLKSQKISDTVAEKVTGHMAEKIKEQLGQITTNVNTKLETATTQLEAATKDNFDKAKTELVSVQQALTSEIQSATTKISEIKADHVVQNTQFGAMREEVSTIFAETNNLTRGNTALQANVIGITNNLDKLAKHTDEATSKLDKFEKCANDIDQQFKDFGDKTTTIATGVEDLLKKAEVAQKIAQEAVQNPDPNNNFAVGFTPLAFHAHHKNHRFVAEIELAGGLRENSGVPFIGVFFNVFSYVVAYFYSPVFRDGPGNHFAARLELKGHSIRFEGGKTDNIGYSIATYNFFPRNFFRACPDRLQAGFNMINEEGNHRFFFSLNTTLNTASRRPVNFLPKVLKWLPFQTGFNPFKIGVQSTYPGRERADSLSPNYSLNETRGFTLQDSLRLRNIEKMGYSVHEKVNLVADGVKNVQKEMTPLELTTKHHSLSNETFAEIKKAIATLFKVQDFSQKKTSENFQKLDKSFEETDKKLVDLSKTVEITCAPHCCEKKLIKAPQSQRWEIFHLCYRF